jgi:hypothetical protein
VTKEAKDGDFGFSLDRFIPRSIKTDGTFIPFVKALNVDGIFVGHEHSVCTSIRYEDIVWTFGLKTGQYDFHIPYQMGGTLITLQGASFRVNHMPSLAPCGAMPAKARMFRGFLVSGEEQM